MRLTLPCYPVCQPAKILLSRVSRVRVRARVRVKVRVRVTVRVTVTVMVSVSGRPRGRDAQRLTLETLDYKILAGWHTG